MKNKGFSLIELLMVITIMGVIFTMFYQTFFYQEKSMRRQRQISELNMKARKASHYMVNELRQIGFSGRGLSPLHTFGIVSGNVNSIQYTHDLDGSTVGVVDAEDIHTISINGDTLLIDGDWALTFVDSLGFTYIDIRGSKVSTPVSEVNTGGSWILPGMSHPISRIEFTIRLVYPYSRDTVTYRNTVAIRNLRP
ncbi:type II secretion system protein [candidate division WOR-3 bacterium]|nr:type II secretion system protein [candidate division WOR-3 bacterium]